jgi:hypothetical protein
MNFQPELFEIHYPIAPVEKKLRKKAQVYIPEHSIGKFDNRLMFREVARFLNISPRTLLNLKNRGFNHIQLSDRKFYYLERDVLAFVNRNYHPPQILDEDYIFPPLNLKDKLLNPSDVVEFFEGTISYSLISSYRNERKLGFVQLAGTTFRFPERDILTFINRNYKNRLSYE